MGHLDVTFNDEGEIEYHRGNPILLDNTVVQGKNIRVQKCNLKK